LEDEVDICEYLFFLSWGNLKLFLLVHKQKDVISLEREMDSEEEAEEEEAEEYGDALELNGISSSSEEESEGFEEGEDGEEGFSEEDSDEVGVDSEEEGEDDGLVDEDEFSLRWGKNKNKFYGTDAKERRREDEVAAEEELEALRLQRKKLGALAQQDFEDELSLEFRAQEGKEKVELCGSFFQHILKLHYKKKKQKKGSIKELDIDVDDVTLDDVETIRKDFSSLSKEQKLEILKRDSPELQELVKEFKESIVDVREKIRPLIERYF